MSLNKHELRYILYSFLFATVWFIFLMPYLQKYSLSMPPAFQFLLFNLGLLVFLQIFLKSMILNKSINFKMALGLVCLIIAMDVMLPPFFVGLDGKLSESTTIFYKSSSDYNIGNFVINTLGIHGFMAFAVTYIIFPVLLLLISALFISNFVRMI